MTSHELTGMSGHLETQIVLTDASALPDLQIAPLRNPAPTRDNNGPLTLESWEKALNNRHQGRRASQDKPDREGRSSSIIKPSDVLSAREAKKPHLAISELVDTNQDEFQLLQLPSFVSLSVVEKSPVPLASQINPHKRPRLEFDNDTGVVEMNRVLPRPSKKDEKQARPVPLLPAMVTGLHEPPPSARLLPSMSDARPAPGRSATVSKMTVKEILTDNKHASKRRPPEAMLNSPDAVPAELAQPTRKCSAMNIEKHPAGDKITDPPITTKDRKSRRQYRKWTDQETIDLALGVKKYGSGKWKQILLDPSFSFGERTAVDLKDRYRVLPKDFLKVHLAAQTSDSRDSTSDMQHQVVESISSEVSSGAQRHRKKRQRWTFAEDAALMTGVTKHGFQWSAIHSDSEMDWGSRRPTDLRDRIRTLFPEGYKRAETRPLARERDKPEATQRDSNDFSDPRNDKSHRNANTQDATRSGTYSTKENMIGEQVIDVGDERMYGAMELNSGNKSKETREVHQAEQAGITLPSLALGDDGTEWNNRLPPLLDWEEI